MKRFIKYIVTASLLLSVSFQNVYANSNDETDLEEATNIMQQFINDNS